MALAEERFDGFSKWNPSLDFHRQPPNVLRGVNNVQLENGVIFPAMSIYDVINGQLDPGVETDPPFSMFQYTSRTYGGEDIQYLLTSMFNNSNVYVVKFDSEDLPDQSDITRLSTTLGPFYSAGVLADFMILGRNSSGAPQKYDASANALFQAGITAPTAAPTVVGDTASGTLPAGDYSYRYVFKRDVSSKVTRSDPSAISATATIGAPGKVTLSAIEVSPDAQVTHVDIYRSKVDEEGGPWFFLATILDGVTTYVDDGTDTLSSNLLETDHDLPPEGDVVAAAFARMWYKGTGADKGTLFYSKALRASGDGTENDFEYVPLLNRFSVIDDSNDEILGMFGRANRLVVWGRRALFEIIPTEDPNIPFVKRRIPAGGATPLGNLAVTAVPRGGSEALAMVTGIGVMLLHANGAIDRLSSPEFDNPKQVGETSGFDLGPDNAADFFMAGYSVSSDRLHVTVGRSSSQAATEMFFYDFSNEHWGELPFLLSAYVQVAQNIDTTGAPASSLDKVKKPFLIAGTRAGGIFGIERWSGSLSFRGFGNFNAIDASNFDGTITSKTASSILDTANSFGTDGKLQGKPVLVVGAADRRPKAYLYIDTETSSTELSVIGSTASVEVGDLYYLGAMPLDFETAYFGAKVPGNKLMHMLEVLYTNQTIHSLDTLASGQVPVFDIRGQKEEVIASGSFPLFDVSARLTDQEDAVTRDYLATTFKRMRFLFNTYITNTDSEDFGIAEIALHYEPMPNEVGINAGVD